MKKLSLIYSLELFPLFNIFTKYRTTVFMMHRFCKWGDRKGGLVPHLPTDILDRCLQYLKENNYSVIPLSEYVQRLKDTTGLHKTVVLTVDDGYQDFYYYAYPVLRKYNMPAAVFIVSDFIDGDTELWWDQIESAINSSVDNEIEINMDGERLLFPLRDKREREYAIKQIVEYCKTILQDHRCQLIEQIKRILNVNSISTMQKKTPQALSWDQIREMQDNSVEFFPHTKTHPILTRCAEEIIIREVSESKRKLESKIGRPADIFCYPNGRHSDLDDRVIALLKRSGYTAAFTAESGYDYARGKIDFFRLRRYPFPEDFISFKRLVSGLEACISLFKKI